MMIDCKIGMISKEMPIVDWWDALEKLSKERELADKEKGLAMAFMKKMMGNKGRYFNEVKKWTR